jgi:tRNA (guanine37-N1)-methyltransferase
MTPFITFITLFPDMIDHATQVGVVGRARERGLWRLATVNPRDFTNDPHRTVDDRPYGGGPGMVMLAQPLADAITAARAQQQEAGMTTSHVVYKSPSGAPLKHRRVNKIKTSVQSGVGLILLCGRYEGVDERLLTRYVDEQISVGDFVVSGGELPALMLADAVVRLLPGAVNDSQSIEEESFVHGLLDYPQYTRPENFEGMTVPEVLLSGHHANIAGWRREQQMLKTLELRPDLLDE